MKLVKLKVEQLMGPALDWAVAKAVGGNPWVSPFGGVGFDSDCWALAPYQPSISWDHCGPLIERFNIGLTVMNGSWLATEGEHSGGCGESCYGGNQREAACRAIVLSQLGEEVEVPETLVESGIL